MCRVLVIDDQEIVRKCLRRIIERSKHLFEVAEASSGREALRLLSAPNYHPDLVLLDVKMPQMSGYEFIEAAGLEHDLGASVVMISGSGERPKAMSYSCVKGFLEKPFSLIEVLDLCEQLIYGELE
ncbi:MAG: response regulator [Fuerstiella sp.]